MNLKGKRRLLTRRLVRLVMVAQDASDEILLSAICEACSSPGRGEIRVRFPDGRELVWTFNERKANDGKSDHSGH